MQYQVRFEIIIPFYLFRIFFIEKLKIEMATTDQQMQLKDAMARAKQVSIHKSNQ